MYCRGSVTLKKKLKYSINYIIQQKVKSLSGAATYSYIMKPTPTGVMITEASVQEFHQFTPLYEIRDATQMETRQDICLFTIELNELYLC